MSEETSYAWVEVMPCGCTDGALQRADGTWRICGYCLGRKSVYVVD